MTKDELVKSVSDSIVSDLNKDAWSRNANGMPLLEGETYRIKNPAVADNIGTDSITTGAQAGTKFKFFKTVEDTNIGFAAIARKGNGLGLEGKTRADLVCDFVGKLYERIGEDNIDNPDATVAITVQSLKTRPGQNGPMIVPTFAW